MTDYAHVTDGTVDQTGLPETGTLSDGRAVSGYDKLPSDVLKAEGWLPLVNEPPAYDDTRQSLTQTGYTVTADKVTVGYEVAWLPPTLTADPLTIAVGATTTVTYSDYTDSAPTSVTFTINGVASKVSLVKGVAQVDVQATIEGTIDVSVDALDTQAVTIVVTAS